MKKSVRILLLLILALMFASVAFAQDSVVVGDEIEGEADGDPIEYEIELVEDQTIEVTLESDDFDTYLSILDEDGDVLEENDDIDFPDNTNSSIEFTADDDGTYTIQVDAFGTPEGDFTLTIEGDEVAEDTDAEDADAEDEDADSADVDLAYGDEIEVDADGEDEVEVTFEGAEGDVVTIIARSSEDQYLKITLIDPEDDDVAIFDEFSFGDAALIRIPLEADGVYTIVVEERSGEELQDEIEVEIIETEVLDLDEGPQTTLIESDIALDYMIFEAEEDVLYLIEVFLDDDIDSSLDINVFEEDDQTYSPSASIGTNGSEEVAFVFEASDDGIVTIELEYFGFDAEIEVTIQVSVFE